MLTDADGLAGRLLGCGPRRLDRVARLERDDALLVREQHLPHLLHQGPVRASLMS